MIDLNKPSFIEEHLARVMGIVVGSISSMQAEQKAAKAQAGQNKKRQDAELLLVRQKHND